MKKSTTFLELYQRNAEINQFSQQWPTITMMIGGRIESFHRQNAVYLGILHEKIKKLMDDNISKDADDKYERITEEGKTAKWKFFSEEHEKTFTADWKELMEKPCSLII